MGKNSLLTLKPLIIDGSWELDSWITKEGEEILYVDLDAKHLDNIIDMLKKKKGKKSPHLKFLIKEKERRLIEASKAGKILYGTK